MNERMNERLLKHEGQASQHLVPGSVPYTCLALNSSSERWALKAGAQGGHTPSPAVACPVGRRPPRARDRPEPASCPTVPATGGWDPSPSECLVPGNPPPDLVPGPHLTPTSAHWRAVASLPVLPAAEGPLKASAFPHSPLLSSLAISFPQASIRATQGQNCSQCFQEPLILVRGSHSALSATATAPSLGGLADSRKPTSQPREATAGTGWAFLGPQQKAQKLQLLFLNDTAARQKLL